MNKKHILFQFLGMAFKTHKPYFFVLLSQTIILAGQMVFGSYTLSLLIEFMETKEYKEAIYAAVILVGVEVVLAFLNKYSSYLLTIHETKMQEAIDHVIAKKVLSIPFSYLEDPYYLELKKNAQMGVNNMGAIYTLLQCFSKILSSSITLIGLAAIIINFDPILLIVLGLSLIHI